MAPQRRKLIIASAGVRKLSGHPLNELLGHRQAAATLGLHATILVPRHISREFVEMIGAKPVLEPFTLRSPFRLDRAISQLTTFATGPRRLTSLWAEIEREGPTRSDLILFTMAQPDVIAAAGNWLAGRPASSRPAIFFRFFGRNFKEGKGQRFGGEAIFYRLACEQLRGAPGQERLFLLADTDGGARMISRATGRRVFAMPMPKRLEESPAGHDRSDRSTRQTVYVHMNPYSAKVYPMLEEVFRAIRARYAAVRFLVKNTGTFAVERIIAPVPGFIEWLPTEQDQTAYLENFQRASVVLLAYGPEEYRAASSGVFIDAASFGNLIVAPAGTWMAEQLERGVGVGTTFDAASAGSIAEALLRVLGAATTLLPVASAAAARVRAENGCEKYIERMIELAESGADMDPIFQLGERLDFGDPLEARQFLGAGWGEIEDWGVWTNGETAKLQFQFGAPIPQPARLRALVHGFLHPSHPRIIIRVAVGDRRVSEWVLDRSDPQPTRWCEAPLPADVRSAFEVSFAVDRPASPQSLGLSQDQRLLGLGLHQVTIEPRPG